MKLKDRCVVITGAASGIGRACALEFAKAGASVVAGDINFKVVEETVELIIRSGGIARPFKVDVSNPDSVKDFTEYAVSKFSSIHVLVNNAAIQINKLVEDTSFDEWNKQLSVNLGGVFLCSKYFLPHLRKTKGSIVNMSSVNGFFVEPQCAGYCASKAAIIGFTKAMAIDHGREGIRINCICPGYIDAGLAESYFQVQKDPVKAREEAGKLHALGRIGRAEEVARIAVFLASDDASFVTGSSVVVDGGLGSGLPPH